MAEEGEIDIEGDFDFKLEAYSDIYDTNELPSKSANLLPEYTNPPWLLEQGWTLDSCMDEKSKATIEKMLLEEQHYLNSKPSTRFSSGAKSAPRQQDKAGVGRRQWTQDEKSMFETGMEVHGRKWRLIADMIPTKTMLQVKNYAHQYLKNQAKKNGITNTAISFAEVTQSYTSTPLDSALSSVSTAKPTVNIVNNCSKRSPVKRKRKQQLSKRIIAETNEDMSLGDLHHTNSSTLETYIHDPKPDIVSNDIETSHVFFSTIMMNTIDIPVSNISKTVNGFLETVTPLVETLNAPMQDTGVSDDDFEIDVDGDVDIEDEDDNSILKSRSASPNSVYEKLLQSANITKPFSLKKTSDTILEKSSPKTSSCIDKESQNDEPSGSNLLTNQSSIVTVEMETHSKSLHNSSVENSDDSSNSSLHAMEKRIVNAVVLFDGSTVQFPVPKTERFLKRTVITDEERKTHLEFFDGRPSKTPERYLKIRNYIIDSWLSCKPSYLNKTSVRPGLKNCGDVNCIGRIHAYLECTGVINFGCEQATYNHPSKLGVSTPRDCIVKEVKQGAQLAKMEAMRPRKRRIRDAFGLWVYETEIEGKTIEHKNSEKDVKQRIPRQSKSIYDPFKLIPCASFSEERQAPFSVCVMNTVLITIDVHAHISKTEVIGMLGGLYNDEQRQLIINLAVPCESISTGMQCEMEPVSQTEASEEICTAGLIVVGWYHSHPTFAPNPSVRDIETQIKFQTWFSTGGSQFVGMIVSPYSRSSSGLISQFNCLTVIEDTTVPVNISNVPYSFDYEVVISDIDQHAICSVLGKLADKYSVFQNRVELTLMYRASTGISCLQKMIESIRSSCFKSQQTDEIMQYIEWKFSDAFSLKDYEDISSPDEKDLKLNTSVDHGS
ncbi:hypothetical protein ScPMuIL_005583 [Solemya velum]